MHIMHIIWAHPPIYLNSSLCSAVKNLPAMQEPQEPGAQFNPWVRKIPWRRAWQPTSVFLPGESPWTEELGGLQSMGSQESDMTEQLHFHFSLSCTGKGNGNPLQYFCLENPRDRGAWWATVDEAARVRHD